jgi:hypothetical protein
MTGAKYGEGDRNGSTGVFDGAYDGVYHQIHPYNM